MNTKPITDLEHGQRYSETLDRAEINTFDHFDASQDPDRIWITYRDQDGDLRRDNAPRTLHVFPAGPAPSVVKAAAAQLQAELSHPAMQAAIARVLDQD